MKYKRYTVNAPLLLSELIDERIPEIPYDSESGYFLGLAIYDLWCRREHKITAKLMAAPAAVRDEAMVTLAERFKSGTRSNKPGWFDNFVESIVEEKLAQAKAIEPKVIEDPKPAAPKPKATKKPRRKKMTENAKAGGKKPKRDSKR